MSAAPHPLETVIAGLPDEFRVEDFTLRAVRRIAHDENDQPAEFRYIMAATGIRVRNAQPVVQRGFVYTHYTFIAKFDPERTFGMGLYTPMPGDTLDIWWREHQLSHYAPLTSFPPFDSLGFEQFGHIRSARIIYEFMGTHPQAVQWTWE